MFSGWIRAVVCRRAYGVRTFGPVAVALRQPRYLKDDERWFRPRRSETVSEPPLRLLREGSDEERQASCSDESLDWPFVLALQPLFVAVRVWPGEAVPLRRIVCALRQ